MARYNSVNITGSVAGGSTISTPSSGLLTTLTGSGTVTVPNPVYYTGQIQTFYNSTLAALTLTTPSGNFVAPGFTSASSISIASAAIITIVSDGTNYLTQGWLGGIGVFTSLTAAGGTVTLNGTTTGSIDNIVIGGTTPKAATFNGLTNTLGTTTLAGGSASGVFQFTSSQASSANNNGAIVVTGGAGIGGNLYVGGISVVGTYGTPSTGAGFRTNTTDIYGQTAAVDKIRLSITGDSFFNSGGNVGIRTSTPRSVLNISDGPLTIDVDSTTTSSTKMDPTSTNNVIYVRAPFDSNPATLPNAGARWGIVFSGGPSADNTSYPVNASTASIGKAASIYAVSEDTGAGYNRSVGLAFYTSGFDVNQAERIRIAGNGNVGIGTNNPIGYNLTVVGTIGSTGNIYSSTSDIRLKDIVKPIVNAIDIIKAIETFYYRNNELALSLGLQGTDLQVGISAQSALKVAPEVTAPAPLDPNYLTVMYERIVPFLIEAIKDQQKDIDMLKEKINYLEGKQ